MLAQDDLNLRILRMFGSTFLLEEAQKCMKQCSILLIFQSL